jgi:hypothetical protein
MINVMVSVYHVFDRQPVGSGLFQKQVMVSRRINKEPFFGLFIRDQIAKIAEVSYFELSDKHDFFSSVIPPSYFIAASESWVFSRERFGIAAA